MGGGGGATDDDAIAILDAAERFGRDLDLSPEAQAERDLIAESLSEWSTRPAKDPDQYDFPGVIEKQTTNNKGDIVVQVVVPWDFRHEVFRALETMPFAAVFHLQAAEIID